MDTLKEGVLENRSLYEEAIRRQVCSHCIDLGAEGTCHTQDPEGCAIFRHLPGLVKIAQRIHDYRISPYLDAVREEICMKCRNGRAGGECPLRDTLDCGLDRYLPLVLLAIEEVIEEKEWSLWRTL